MQRGRFKEESGQGMWLSLFFSTITAFVIMVLAIFHPVFHHENLSHLLWLLILSTWVGFPNAVYGTELKKAMRFKKLAIAHFVSGSFYTCATVYLAWLGWGPYALLAPLAIRQVVDLIAVVLAGARVNYAWPNWPAIWQLFVPSVALSFSSLLTAFQTQAPVLVCGYALGAEATGYFSWGWALASQSVFLLAFSLREVFFAAFANISAESGARERAVLKVAWIMTALLFVACGTQALLAGPLITFILPAKWLPAIPVVVAASLGLFLQGLWVAGTAYLNVCGRYTVLMVISVMQAVLVSAFTGLGALWYGSTGAAVGCGMATLIGGIVCAWPVGKNLFTSQAHKWVIPALSCLGLWATLWGLTLIGGGLFARTVAGFVFMAGSTWLWWREDPSEFTDLMTGIIRRFTGTVAQA